MKNIQRRKASLDSPNTTPAHIPPCNEAIEAATIARADIDGNGMRAYHGRRVICPVMHDAVGA
jgi:hypothetical protein